MGWSRTEPELPAGSDWEQVGTTAWKNNNTVINSVIYAARLSGRGIAIKMVETRQHLINQWSGVWTDSALRCDIDGVEGEVDTSFNSDGGYGKTVTQTVYFTGEANAGVSVTVFVGLNASNGNSTTFDAPPLLGSTVFVKVNGVWRQGQMKIKVNGVWTDATAKINIGGTWK